MTISPAKRLTPDDGTGASAPVSQQSDAYSEAGGVDLSVIVPTFNERDNIDALLARLEACLDGISWEVIFVDDDSPDGTAAIVRQRARCDRRVRCVQRLGRRGLSSACIEGMLSSSAPYLAVIDADLQHDESLLPAMHDLLWREEADLVVASRYMEGGGIGDWSRRRAAVSRLATRLGALVLRADLTDPMSGFFMIRREVLDDTARGLSGLGFKILVDLVASSPRPLRVRELPYRFRTRHAGESKLDANVAWEFAALLLDKLVGRYVPVRFVTFTLVGSLGVGVHLLALDLLFRGLGMTFVTGQAIAALAAMTSNFALNNVLTYRDRRLRGWRWLRGWLSFVLACSVGAAANVGIAAYLFQADTYWLLSALAGILVGAVWNYALTSVYTWNAPRSGRARSGS